MLAELRPWIEATGVVLLTVIGGLLGCWFSRQRTPYWLLGYFLPLGAIVVYGVGMHVASLATTPPFSWLVLGRAKFAVIGFLAALVLVTPLSRIPRRPARILILALLILMVWHMSLWPFLAPAFNRKHLASIQTQVDADGVCLQSNEYNCGPAAAVTALRQLGLPAEEGEIAILAHTSSAIGTPPDLLAAALQRRYASDGLLAEHCTFRDVSELRGAGLTLAVIKFSFMLDHYVAVLEVTNEEILVGDPLNGLTRWTPEEFEDCWRHHGVVLRMRGGKSAEP